MAVAGAGYTHEPTHLSTYRDSDRSLLTLPAPAKKRFKLLTPQETHQRIGPNKSTKSVVANLSKGL